MAATITTLSVVAFIENDNKIIPRLNGNDAATRRRKFCIQMGQRLFDSARIKRARDGNSNDNSLLIIRQDNGINLENQFLESKQKREIRKFESREIQKFVHSQSFYVQNCIHRTGIPVSGSASTTVIDYLSSLCPFWTLKKAECQKLVLECLQCQNNLRFGIGEVENL
ncbi:hypothetical protein Ddc_12999 [Ditylenchus destructor]|nr:hypothetical protein Ddc_12999 [Ditylenchus destructor]